MENKDKTYFVKWKRHKDVKKVSDCFTYYLIGGEMGQWKTEIRTNKVEDIKIQDF